MLLKLGRGQDAQVDAVGGTSPANLTCFELVAFFDLCLSERTLEIQLEVSPQAVAIIG